MTKLVNYFLVFSSFLLFSAAASALPPEATQALTDVGNEVSVVEAAVWPVIGAVIVAIVSIRLVKRFSNKI